MLRRISQLVFLLLFLGLLFFPSWSLFPSAGTEIHLRPPVRLFFEWDPLVALVNALAGHALYRGLIWCLVILGTALLWSTFFGGSYADQITGMAVAPTGDIVVSG